VAARAGLAVLAAAAVERTALWALLLCDLLDSTFSASICPAMDKLLISSAVQCSLRQTLQEAKVVL